MKTKQLSTVFQNILFAFFIAIIVFALLEIAARVYLVHFASKEAFNTYASFSQLKAKNPQPKWSPHPYLGHYPTPNYERRKNKHNSLGFRGDEIVQPKPDGEFRIVAIGGSTTYTSNVKDYRLSYPAQLEKELGERGYQHVKVINAGASKYSSWESLINFAFRVLDLQPDMIIIYHAVNDIHPRLVWPPEFYRGDNFGKKGNKQPISIPGVLEYSTILRIIMIELGITSPHNDLERNVSETFYGNLFNEQKYTNRYPSGFFKEVSIQHMLNTNKPVYFKRNLENIIAIARYRHIKVMLATFAFSPHFSHPRASSQEYISAYEEMNETMRTVARENNVALFDFAGVFPKDKTYYTDGRHLNEKGAQLKANLFSDYIIKNDLIDGDISFGLKFD